MAEKRYLVFRGSNYYPAGGMEDFHSSYETRLEAYQTALRLLEWKSDYFASPEADWVQVWDAETSPENARFFHKNSINDLKRHLQPESCDESDQAKDA